MKTTLLYAHPWEGSFNKAILDTIIAKRKKQGNEIALIDLNKENFDPVLGEKGLSRFAKGEFNDPQVGVYQKILQETEELIIQFPIWWYDAPAILQGFFDKVMLKDFAYKSSKLGLKGLLTHIRKTTLVTTAESPKWYLSLFCGNPIGKKWKRRILKDIGVKNIRWIHNGFTASGGREKNGKFLEKIEKRI